MFVVVGLVFQFQQSLSKFLTGSRSRTTKSLDQQDLVSNDVITPDLVTPGRSRLMLWGPTWLLLGVLGLYFGKNLVESISPVTTKEATIAASYKDYLQKSSSVNKPLRDHFLDLDPESTEILKKHRKGSEIRLDLLGQMPVTFGGRVQPLDSFARNTARRLCNREYVNDVTGEKQPAIRWLADSMFQFPGYDEYEILRIEDPNVQNALGLNEELNEATGKVEVRRRKGMRYRFQRFATQIEN